MTPLFIIFFAAMGLTIAGTGILIARHVQSPARQLSRRIEEFTGAQKESDPVAHRIVRDQSFSGIPALNRLVEKLSVMRKLSRLLVQADSTMTAGKMLLIIFIMALTGLLISLRLNLFSKIILTAGLGSLPVIHLQIQRSKRLKAFIRAFPDSIDMMASAIRAGHAFNQAMHLVGNEAPDPVGMEFKRTYEQYNLGLNLKDVLLEMTERVDSQDLKLFVTAILLQKETGGNLTEILDKISYTIRERFKLIGQIKTFTAQGRMSAIVLGCLPVAFVAILSGLNPEYLEPMFHDKLGHWLILISAFLQVFGFLVINRIVRIKYQ
ncbi:type II secretion system F family protein [bacterium]|nr:type II secretion system F family protein [bacterium]